MTENDMRRGSAMMKGEGNMTQLWRMTVAMPKEIEAQLMELRKTDEFCKRSIGKMARVLLEEAIAARKEKNHAEQC